MACFWGGFASDGLGKFISVAIGWPRVPHTRSACSCLLPVCIWGGGDGSEGVTRVPAMLPRGFVYVYVALAPLRAVDPKVSPHLPVVVAHSSRTRVWACLVARGQFLGGLCVPRRNSCPWVFRARYWVSACSWCNSASDEPLWPTPLPRAGPHCAPRKRCALVCWQHSHDVAWRSDGPFSPHCPSSFVSLVTAGRAR